MKRAIALIVIFTIGILLRVIFLNVPADRIGPDEDFYLKYAAYMAQDKNASIKTLFDQYLGDEKMHLYPNPLRYGYIILTAAWMRLINRFDFQALCYLSALFGILSLFLGYLFMNKLFGGKIAMLGLMLLAVSPINLAMARRALQDSAVYFFSIAALYLFYLALTKKSVLFKIFFAVSFFAAISIKESNVLLAAFFIFFALWDKTFFRKDLNLTMLLIVLIVSLVAVFSSYILIAGGIKPVLSMGKIILASPLTNEYAAKYQSGGLLRYAFDFFLISPITAIAAGCFLILYLVRQNLQNEATAYVVTFLLICYLTYSFFSKNLRYVMAIDLPIRICAALFIVNLSEVFKRRGAIVAFITIAAIAVVDIRIFKHIFLTRGVYDPVTAVLRACWE